MYRATFLYDRELDLIWYTIDLVDDNIIILLFFDDIYPIFSMVDNWFCSVLTENNDS